MAAYQDDPFEVVYALAIGQFLQESSFVCSSLVVEVLDRFHFCHPAHVQQSCPYDTTFHLPDAQVGWSYRQKKVELRLVAFDMSEHGPGNNPTKGEPNNIDMFYTSVPLEIFVDLNTSKFSQFTQTGVGALPRGKGLNGMKMCEP